MASYHYKALSVSGSVVKGVLEAPSDADAVQLVRNLGHYPISASPSPDLGWLAQARSALKRRAISGRELALFTHELATLLEAGLELDNALDLLRGTAETKSLAAPLGRVVERLRDGANFAEALERERVFPKLYVSLVRAGDWSGALVPALKQLADYLSREQATRETITSALIYPMLLLTTAGLSITFLLVFVMPSFEHVFADAGAKLPMATRIVIGFAHFVRDWWWALIAVFIGLLAAARRLLRKPERRRKFDRAMLRLPLLGDLFRKMETERLCRTSATLLAGGVPLPNALSLARDALGNTAMAHAVEEAVEDLKEGERLAPCLARSALFPTMTIDIIRVGEMTGKLDAMLRHHAELLESSVRHLTDRLLAALVPALTIFLGLMVGSLIASMLMAVLSVNDLVM